MSETLRNGEAPHLPVRDHVRIEEGIPFPARPAPYTTTRATYPFAQMRIGDSFETPKASVMSAATKYRDRMAALGEVVVLVVRKQKNGTYRCWRLDPDAPEVAAEVRPRGRRARAKSPGKKTGTARR